MDDATHFYFFYSRYVSFDCSILVMLSHFNSRFHQNNNQILSLPPYFKVNNFVPLIHIQHANLPWKAYLDKIYITINQKDIDCPHKGFPRDKV